MSILKVLNQKSSRLTSCTPVKQTTIAATKAKNKKNKKKQTKLKERKKEKSN